MQDASLTFAHAPNAETQCQFGKFRAGGLVPGMIGTQSSEQNRDRLSNQSVSAGYVFGSTVGALAWTWPQTGLARSGASSKIERNLVVNHLKVISFSSLNKDEKLLPNQLQ